MLDYHKCKKCGKTKHIACFGLPDAPEICRTCYFASREDVNTKRNLVKGEALIFRDGKYQWERVR